MLRVNLVCVGNLKEKFWVDATNEYIKRLSRFCQLKVVEIEEQTHLEGDKLLEKEGKDIIKKMGENPYLLAIEGREFSSPDFASFIDKACQEGEITFIIGGSYGVSEEVKRAVKGEISFGKATYPHNLARVILLEQLYRAFMINSGAKYHK